MSYQTVSHEDMAVDEKPSSGIGWIVLAVIAVVIIIVIVWFFFREEGTTVSSVTHTWILVNNSNGGAQTFDAAGGNMYVNSAKSAVALTLTPPANPQGQEFIINNSLGGGNIVIASGVTVIDTISYNGVNVYPPANTVIKGKTSAYVWRDSTSILKLY